MKKMLRFIFVFNMLLGMVSPCFAQGNASAYLNLHETKFDFSDISSGQIVSHDFEIKNSGKEFLIIKEVLVTCGCTVSSWPKEPLAPGDSSVIKISFDSNGKIGRQNKVIRIISNAENNPEKITISANVLPN